MNGSMTRTLRSLILICLLTRPFFLNVEDEENHHWEEEVARGRLSSVSVEEFNRGEDMTEIDIQGFSKAVGPITIHQAGALALDFLLLFMSNGILQNIMRETNQYASQTLQSMNKDPANGRKCQWKS